MSNLFQSLIGFKINWNTPDSTPAGLPLVFQSLIGFKINWNNLQFSLSSEYLVSIPNRV